MVTVKGVERHSAPRGAFSSPAVALREVKLTVAEGLPTPNGHLQRLSGSALGHPSADVISHPPTTQKAAEGDAWNLPQPGSSNSTERSASV